MTVVHERSDTPSAKPATLPPPSVMESQRYEIHDHVTAVAPEGQAGVLDVWIPVIPETPYQRVLDMEVTVPGPWQIRREAEFGNLVLHSRLALPANSTAQMHLRCAVERVPVRLRLDAVTVRTIATPELFSRCWGRSSSSR